MSRTIKHLGTFESYDIQERSDSLDSNVDLVRCLYALVSRYYTLRVLYTNRKLNTIRTKREYERAHVYC